MRVSARRRFLSCLVGLTVVAAAGVALRVDHAPFNSRATAADSFQPQDVGAPSAAELPDGSTQVVFWKSPWGHLVESWYSGDTWNGPVDLTAAYFGGADPLQSAPHATIAPDGTQLVFWQGTTGDLVEAWWNGHWNGPVDWSAAFGWSPTMTSAPSATLAADGTQLIFWQGGAGHLYEAWWDGHWNGPVDWTAANGWAGSLTSAPAVTMAPDGSQVIFWQGVAGHLYEAWWHGRWNGPVDWTAANGWAMPVRSAPAVATIADGTQVIFWQGASGHLVEAWWKQRWNGPVDWTAAKSWGSTLTSAPTVAVTPDGVTQAVFWEGAGQSLREAWFNGAWNGPADFSPPPVCSTSLPAGKVITVSLSQQSAVYYQDRCSVNSSLVTTGRPGLRTPTGSFHIFSRSSPIRFVSPWPPSSPNYYSPETTQWGLGYESGGFYFHDAPWEPVDGFGPGSQDGPSASHGCIHVPTPVMEWLYGWAGIGTTVIVTG